jgi:hypothetical protein
MFDFSECKQTSKLSDEMAKQLAYLKGFPAQRERLEKMTPKVLEIAGNYVEEKQLDRATSWFAIAAQFETALALSRIAELMNKKEGRY